MPPGEFTREPVWGGRRLTWWRSTLAIMAALSTAVLLAEREGLISLQQLDAVVEGLSGLVLEVAQGMLETIKGVRREM
jgi:hypothetical protein